MENSHMKIKVALLDKDKTYLDRIAGVFNTKYADKIEIYSFTDVKTAIESIKAYRIDVLVAEEEFDIDKNLFKRNCGLAYFTDTPGIELIKDEIAICKFQKADLIFKQILGVYSDMAANVASDDYNLRLNFVMHETAIPGVYQFWHNKYQGADETKIEEYKNDKKSAKNKQDEITDEAKNKTNPHSDSQEISKEIDNINATFGNSTFFTSFVSLIGNLAGGNFESIRDNLYISTYMLEMFSYSTIDNEGRYNILKSNGFDMSTLNKSNYSEKYTSVNDKWTSEDYKDYYNKSLTNKMLNKDAAYGCELEYILYGGSNDENIKSAYGQIYEIRYILNLISAFQNFWNQDTITGKAIFTIAYAISSGTAGVVPIPIVKVVLILLLTVFETANDSNRLEAGFAVELYKTEASMWQVSLDFDNASSEGISSIAQMMSTLKDRFDGGFVNSCGNGIRYSDYLCMFIICGMQSGIGESMTLRCADIIQTNMRKVTSNDSYKLENAKTYFELDLQLRVDPLLITLPLYSDYTEAYDSSNTDWCTYNIKTIRGY